MDLEFTKQDNVYAAEATVHGDYNLHIERKASGRLWIFQRSTPSGEYALCSGMPYWLANTGKVIDYAFTHGVYPEGGLHIRIESESEVTVGVLNEGAV